VIDKIKNLIENKFKLKPEILEVNNKIFLKIIGIDNLSLSKWLQEEIKELKIDVKQTAAYQFSNDGWIKIEV
jgi:hypothetical protein